MSSALGRDVRVVFGKARRNVIVARDRGHELELRLNERFADAPEDVFEALVAWLRSGKRARKACARLDEWIAELAKDLGPPRRREVTIRASGEAHDLRRIAEDVLRAEFPGELAPDQAERVTWGRRGTRPARRSLQLGSYDAERRLVRLHPVLDQAAVPEHFVRYVVFHELLHAAQDEGRRAGELAAPKKRARHHDRWFRNREERYAGYERALAWQARHQSALFQSARSGKPMRVPRTPVGRAVDRISRSAAKAVQGFLFEL